MKFTLKNRLQGPAGKTYTPVTVTINEDQTVEFATKHGHLIISEDQYHQLMRHFLIDLSREIDQHAGYKVEGKGNDPDVYIHLFYGPLEDGSEEYFQVLPDDSE